MLLEAPDIWLPVLLRVAAHHEARRAIVVLLGRLHDAHAWRAPAAALSALSEVLKYYEERDAPPGD